jgi:hypothetical protein
VNRNKENKGHYCKYASRSQGEEESCMAQHLGYDLAMIANWGETVAT